MKAISALLMLVMGFFALSMIGSAFLFVMEFFIDHLALPLIGLWVVASLLGKK